MLFASNVFIFGFLPIVILLYYGFRKSVRFKNLILLLFSLFFYAYGEPKFIIIMVFSIIINYVLGLLIDNSKKCKKLLLIIAVLFNISILIIYKYLTFILTNINNAFKTNFLIPKIVLPIGISFFTFQILSYIIDVYKEKVKVQKNIFDLGLYISFFPQLIAGPIVRYEDIEDQIKNRKETISRFSKGIERFIIGLGKKVILSNTLSIIADYAFDQELMVLSRGTLWLGAIAYTLQIYYDFSGYSDMAIGLGKIFGFEFEENFNDPYISKSISEFWRRWHISLGNWFRDYVYIPLGGSRCSKQRLIINLAVVWFLTGLWHGANWTFIMWGILYFILITIEKITKFEKKHLISIIKWLYTISFVVIGWIIFRSDSISDAFAYMRNMLILKPIWNIKTSELLIENIIILTISIIIATPLKRQCNKIYESEILKIIILSAILILSVSYLVKGVYNPFIYFNF